MDKVRELYSGNNPDGGGEKSYASRTRKSLFGMGWNPATGALYGLFVRKREMNWVMNWFRIILQISENKYIYGWPLPFNMGKMRDQEGKAESLIW